MTDSGTTSDDASVASSTNESGGPEITPSKVKTGAGLHALRATVLSFLDRPIDFYPRLEAKVRSVPSDEIVNRFYNPKHGVMAAWAKIDPNDSNLDKAVDLAKASLQEAKAQTEYQDQKATRLLTVSTFLTALAGAFFASFSTNYPLRNLQDQVGAEWWLLSATYISFLLFILLSLGGALVTFHASRTRFKYPFEATVDSQSGRARSFLFFREIIGVTPEGWANSFVNVGESTGTMTVEINPMLKVEYLKNYVSEAYLVAAKTAEKLRYLQPAQSLLSYALRCLIVYVMLLGYVLTCVEPTKPTPQPTEVEMIGGTLHVDALIERSQTPTQQPTPTNKTDPEQ